MGQCTEVFVGIDVSKARNAIAVAEGERGGEVRFLGEVDASEPIMREAVRRIAAKHDRAHFCYEAGPTGYGLHRLITMCRSRLRDPNLARSEPHRPGYPPDRRTRPLLNMFVIKHGTEMLEGTQDA